MFLVVKAQRTTRVAKVLKFGSAAVMISALVLVASVQLLGEADIPRFLLFATASAAIVVSAFELAVRVPAERPRASAAAKGAGRGRSSVPQSGSLSPAWLPLGATEVTSLPSLCSFIALLLRGWTGGRCSHQPPPSAKANVSECSR
jgi:hypothetical protein